MVKHWVSGHRSTEDANMPPRRLLQENLLQRFLYYDETNRARVSSADLIMCLTHDVLELAHCGFTAKFQRTSSSYRFV